MAVSKIRLYYKYIESYKKIKSSEPLPWEGLKNKGLVETNPMLNMRKKRN